jgi:F-type H+-transporting ATPase subunit a
VTQEVGAPRRSPLAAIAVPMVAFNLAVLAIALIFGLLPPWPDIHVPELSGASVIHIAGEGIGEISISNTIVTMWIVMAFLVLVSIAATRDLRMSPGPLQNGVEIVVQGLADFAQSIGGPRALKYLPIFGTLFIFILLANWLGIVPGVGQVDIFHAPTADYHINVGMALVAFVAYQAEGIGTNGAAYFKRFLNLSGFKEGAFMGAIMVFVGLIELMAELIRVLTLTLRLWGNVLGGEIMLSVMAAVLWVLATPGNLPFIGFEMFIGLLQALIFALLVLMYFLLATESHEEESHEPAQSGGPVT